MPDVIGVRFKPCGKIYDFEADGLEVGKGDLVVVESELEDLVKKEENRKLEAEARGYCMERIMARGLPMKLISTEATLDKKRIIFYFTAEKRIDFRELVKDLASK